MKLKIFMGVAVELQYSRKGLYMRICDMGIQLQHNKKFEIFRENGVSSYGKPDYLFIYFYSNCFVEINGQTIHVKPPAAIIFDVNFRQHYYAEDDRYMDEFIHFLFDESRSFVDEINLPLNQVILLDDNNIIPEMLQMMYEEFLSENVKKDRSLDYMFRLILLKVSELSGRKRELQRVTRYEEMLEALRSQIYLEPAYDWSVSESAMKNGLSTTYFQKLYKKKFGCTFGQDVMTGRLEHAKHLLLTSHYSVKEIAMLCGYNSETFFMKQFKKKLGITPSQYRANSNA